jgi:hypothetical protein
MMTTSTRSKVKRTSSVARPRTRRSPGRQAAPAVCPCGGLRANAARGGSVFAGLGNRFSLTAEVSITRL